MIKLIITDLDGTLLDENGKLPIDFEEVYNALINKNILFVPTSGRQCDNLKKVFEKQKENMIFIGENGALISLPNGEKISTSIPTQTTSKILSTLQKNPQLEFIVGCSNAAYTNSKSQTFIDYSKNYYSNLHVINDISEISDTIIKFAIYDEDAKNNCYPLFKELKKDVQLVLGAKCWLDITSLEASKGSAIKKIQEKFNIKNTETVCFGDYLNDVSMFDESICYHTYAMENAHPELKKLAKFIAPSNTDRGVTKTIKNLLI